MTHRILLAGLSAVLLFFTLAATVSEAQMSSASMFEDVKSTNPAVIGKRTGTRITAIVAADRIKKEHTLDASQGAPVTGQGERAIEVNSVSVFRGGRGGGLTSEMSIDYNMGSATDKLTSTTESQSTKTSANNVLGYLGVGFLENFGLSYTHVVYHNEENFAGSFGGTPFANDFKTDVTAQGIKAGFAKDLGAVDFGLFFVRRMDNIKSTNAGVENTEKEDEDVVAIALGKSSRDFHFEVGYERSLKSIEDPILMRTMTPTRTTATIEFRMGKFLLGYTGRYYFDGFFEVDRLIYNQFVYANSYTEPRLDNTFNFSYGNDKGSVWSGSLFYSSLEAQEASSFFPLAGKVATKTTAMGASIKYSYAF